MLRFAIHYFLLSIIIATVAPYIAPLLRAKGFSTDEIGYLQGGMGLAAVGGPMVIGYLADRYGKRRSLLVASLGLAGLILAALALTSDFWPVLAILAGVGFFWRSPVPLSDTLASHELPNPAYQYGRVRTLGSLGFVVALLVIRGAKLVDEQSAGAMLVAMLISFGLCLLSATLLPDRHRAEDHREAVRSGGAAFDRVFWFFLLAVATQQFGMSAHYAFFTIFLQDTFHMERAAWVWAIGTAAEIPVLYFGGALVQRFGLSRLMAAALAAVTVRLVLYAVVPTLWVILASQLLHALAFGVFFVVAIEFMRRKVPAGRRGLAMALYTSLGLGVPVALGSALGGVICKEYGYYWLYMTYAIPPLLGLAAMLLSRRGLDVPPPAAASAV